MKVTETQNSKTKQHESRRVTGERKENSDNMRTKGIREGDHNKHTFNYVILISVVNKSLANHYICLIHVVEYLFL